MTSAVLIITEVALFLTCLNAQTQIPSHLLPIKSSLEKRDIDSYLSLCAPEIKDDEKASMKAYFDLMGMESISLFFAGESPDSQETRRAFFQVVLENKYSAMIEIWQISYRLTPVGLQIISRTVSSSLTNLYRLHFPGRGRQPARNIQLQQKDLTVTFAEGEIFFNNLPDVDTAMIIIGRGKLYFQPSDEIEVNQLRRIYHKPFFEDDLESIYVRGSPTFFKSNLTYQPIEKWSQAQPEEIINHLVYSIFNRNYPRSFTVENSLTGEYLTFLPQSGETVIEMKTVHRGEFTYVYSPFAEEEISFFDRTRNKLINSYSPSEGEPGQKRMFISFGERFEIKNYNLEVSYKPENNWLAANVCIELISRIDNLDSLQLRFNPALRILKIQDEQGRQLYYTQDQLRRLLYVYLAEKMNRDQIFRLQVYYRGKITPPPPVSDSCLQRMIPDTRVTIGISRETYLFTQSADWYPAPGREKYFTFKMKIVIPDSYYCLASGQLLEKYTVDEAQAPSELENSGNQVFIYASQIPVKYISFFIGHIKPVRKIQDGIYLEHLVGDDWVQVEKGLLPEAEEILQMYQKNFGSYPYKNLAIVQRYWNTAGGHSMPGFIVLNEFPLAREPGVILANPNSPVDLSYWGEYYLAHELAHQWWGHGVTWTSYRDNWLSEGLAQFSAVLYLQRKYGQNELEGVFKKMSGWVRKKSAWGPIILGVRLSHLDFEAYQAIVYNKAALALFMLRDIVGEREFFQGLQQFYQEHLFGAVRTSDFRRAMEKVSGQDLRKFFQDWFYSEDLPQVKIEKKIIQNKGKTLIKLTFKQVKRTMLFPLEIVTESDRGKIRHLVIVGKKEQTLELELDGHLKKMRINPGNKVPGKFY
ncbi:MAG: M1 family metallopeptidase [Candidatus Saccharicenans sp.]